MVANSLFGKALIVTQDWTRDELDEVLKLAVLMKNDRFSSQWTSVLAHKTFFMFFYNPSVRTRQSFECAATELGGHAQFLEPKAMRLKTEKTAGETVEDAAQVMSRYAHGLGIRMLEDKVTRYGEGEDLLREYAKWCTIPVISMAHDKYHPCQGLADILGWAEWMGKGPGNPDFEALKGKKLLMTWGRGALARSWCSVQEAMLIGSRYGMDVTLAHPEGYDLDPQVIKWTEENCAEHGTHYEEVTDPEKGYEGAHVVYSRNWMSPGAYEGGELQKQKEIEMALEQDKEWTSDARKMAMTDDGIWTHPMPVDRGSEVTDEVASGPRSCIYDVAENRLHVQKAIMALTMSQL
ncbi:MAG: ornithine carbamoyltransferase [Candidatus Hodarchaeales archaeon]|jgi:N-acetylornithine carbamoyltransferase